MRLSDIYPNNQHWFRIKVPIILLVLSLLCLTKPSIQAQNLAVLQNNDIEYLINDVLVGGDCYDVTNIQFNGAAIGLGTFSDGNSSIQIDDGIIMTTGNLDNALGPNTSTSILFRQNDSIQTDPDIEQLVGLDSIYDLMIIEFDFVPSSDFIQFDYAFASDEFCEFVGSQYNDVFGFFLSGPGINGSFTNNAVNIATIPGTSDYVAINSVNSQTNPAYYVDNVPVGQLQHTTEFFDCDPDIINTPAAEQEIEYDGFTVPLTAYADVTACERYHIKLVIADISDNIFDSAVFFKGNSFRSGPLVQFHTEVSQASGDLVYEDCYEATLIITREANDAINQALDVAITLSALSTATEGLDFLPLPDTVTFLPFRTELRIPITILSDDLIEGIETIIIELDINCNCSSPFAQIQIADVQDLRVVLPDKRICVGDTTSATIHAFGGIPGYTYEWNDGNTAQHRILNPGDSTLYWVITRDTCTHESRDSFWVYVIPIAQANTISEIRVCEGAVDTSARIEFFGEAPFRFSYTLNGIPQGEITDINDNFYLLPVLDTGIYRITELYSALGCEGIYGTQVRVYFHDYSLTPIIEDVHCFETPTGAIQLIVNAPDLTFSYDWSTNDVTQNINTLMAGIYHVTVTGDRFGCQVIDTFELLEPPALLSQIDLLREPACGLNDGQINVQIDNAQGPILLDWTPSLGTNPNYNMMPAGAFSVEISDSVGCKTSDQITLVDTSNIEIDTVLTDTIYCTQAGQAQLIVNANQPAHTVIWSTGQTDVYSININSTGPHFVIIESLGNCRDTMDFSIPLDQAFPSVILADTFLINCFSPQVLLTATVQPNDAIVNWSTNSGNIISRSDSLIINVDSSAYYSIEIIDPNNGCSIIDSTFVQSDFKNPSIAIDPIDTLTCTHLFDTIRVRSDEENINYAYSYSAGLDFDVLTDSTLIVYNSGFIDVTIFSNINGCSEEIHLDIFENVSEPASNAGQSDTLNCRVDSIELNGIFSSTSAGVNYYWYSDNGQYISDSTLTNPVINSTGNYYFVVENLESHCRDTSSLEIFENLDSPISDAGQDQVLNCTNTQVNLDGSNSSTGSNILYKWETLNGNILSSEQADNIFVDSAGRYFLTVIDVQNQCTSQDSVEVIIDREEPIFTLALPDTLDCERMLVDIQVEQNNPNWQYQWSTTNGHIVGNTVESTLVVDSAAQYYIQITDQLNGCQSIDSALVFVDRMQPTANAGQDQVLPCAPQMVTLNGSGSPANINYAWQLINQNPIISTDQNVIVSAANDYVLTVQNLKNKCLGKDTVNVFNPPPFEATWNIEPITCLLSEAIFSIDAVNSIYGPITYQLNLDTARSINTISDDLSLGFYDVLVTDNLGCTWSDQFNVAPVDSLRISLNSQAEIKIGDSYFIRTTINKTSGEIDFIEWTPTENLDCPDCFDTWVMPDSATNYRVFMIDNVGCQDTASINIFVDRTPHIYIPNAFSPNDDLINDRFTLFGNPAVTNIDELQVFNRWGDKIFEANNIPPNELIYGWDGTFQGEVLDPAVFVYTIVVDLIDGSKRSFKGDINLIK